MLIARGLTNAQIARQLNVSPGTVRNHVTTILAKLGAANRTQAAAWALRAGYPAAAAERCGQRLSQARLLAKRGSGSGGSARSYEPRQLRHGA